MRISGILKNRLKRPAIVAVFLLYQSVAWANCDEDWLTVRQVRDGESTVLYAVNSVDYPITYSVRVHRPGTSSGRSRPMRGTLDGQQSQRLMTLSNDQLQAAEDLSISCHWTIGDSNASHDDDHIYLLPYADGESYLVLQGFGSRFSHRGGEQYAVDFKMDVGTPVHAARSGVVARVVESNDKGCWRDGCGKFANFIVVLHDDGTTGEYYHLQKNGALVEVGDQIKAGQKIGLSGNTGHTALPHLHFAVYRATSRAESQSVPMSFISADGVVHRPRRGHHYLAVTHSQAGD